MAVVLRQLLSQQCPKLRVPLLGAAVVALLGTMHAMPPVRCLATPNQQLQWKPRKKTK